MCFRPSSATIGGEVECPKCGTRNPAASDACKGCGAKASDFAAAPMAPKPPMAPKAPSAPKPPSR